MTHPYMQDERLRKEERLLKRREFLRTQRRGRRYVSALLVVYAARVDRAWSRLGVTVSRKVGGAVVRNRVKRRLREAFRRNKAQLPVGYDFVWIARVGAGQATWEELSAQALAASAQAVKSKSGRRRSGGSRKGRQT